MITQELVAFIEQNLIADERGVPVTEQTDLIEEGIVDSMGLMRIVTYLEDHAGVKVPDDEVGPDNFATVELISRLVERLRRRVG